MQLVHVVLQLPILDALLHTTGIDLNLHLLGAQLAHDVADGGVEVLATDTTDVQLHCFGEDGVAAEEDGGRFGRVLDFQLDKTEDASEDEALGVVDAQEELR